MDHFTVEQFRTILAKNPFHKFPNWRYGQYLFNMLNEYYPNIANIIRATKADPFHRDDRIPLFWDTLASNSTQTEE